MGKRGPLAFVVAFLCAVDGWVIPSKFSRMPVTKMNANRAKGGLSSFGKGPSPRQTCEVDPDKEKELIGHVESIVAESRKENNRDLALLDEACAAAAALVETDAGLSPSRGSLAGDWKLVWASSDDAVCSIGSGLHTLPLTLLEDIFVSFSGGAVETAEVLRVMGPFPNVRNTLAGKFNFPGGGAMSLSYDKMVDGNGGVIKAPDGASTRRVDLRSCFGVSGAMIFLPKGVPDGVLVFEREPDVDAALKALRVDRPEDWDNPKEQFKFPWQN